MNIDITARYVTPAYTNYTPPLEATDATVKIVELKASKSYGVTAGSFFKLFRVGGESAIGLDISAAGEVYKFKVGPLEYGAVLKDLNDDADAMIISVPIGLVYKSGGEVTLNKRNKSIFAIGCGMAPSIAMCKIIEAGNAYNMRRFAMLECGFFAGVAWKVRLAYYSGNTLLVDKKDGMLDAVSSYHGSGPVGKMNVYATGSSVIALCLIVLPFSWDWN